MTTCFICHDVIQWYHRRFYNVNDWVHRRCYIAYHHGYDHGYLTARSTKFS